MPATIAIADNADGTGATATIAGSSGAAIVVSFGRVSGLLGTIALPSTTSRVGDGTVLLASTVPGLYFASWTVAGAFAGLYYFGVSSGLDAVATRVRRSVCDTLRTLAIPPAANVYEQMFPEESNIQYPCIVATVDGVQESEKPILNNRDDLGRPVKVMICDRADRWDHTKLPLYESWRQAADRCFRRQQLAGVPESVECTIEPFVIIDPSARQYQHMVTAFVVRAQCREPRGVGA